MSSKKLVSVALTATTVMWALGVASLPLAQAQTTSSLQAQIAALLAQIQQLQAQLNSSTGSGSSTSCYSFTSDLTVGSRGASVTSLQQLLISKGYLAISAPTGYFGPLTQAALGKFQAANGITPSAGYFGPKTRAFVNAMCSSSSSTTTTTTTTTTGTGTTTVTPPSTGLSVSLDSQNPSAGSLVTTASGYGTTSSARIPVLALDFTASNAGAVTITQINVHKNGVLSDSSIGGAYLIQNGQVLYQYNSLNQGVISFSGLNFSVPAGQTETLFVAIDPSSGLSAGNTVSFSVNSATDITAWNSANTAVTPSGSFPLNGNTFTATTVNNPAVAGLTITSSSIATQVTAGTQNNIVGAWSFNGANSLVWLKGIKFTVIGSANMGDVRNVKLFVNGTQVGATLATVAANGVAYFDLSSTPATLNTGNNNVQVYADVMGSPSKNFQFEVLNSYDVNAIDSQYNVPISVTLTSGADAIITIQQGQITVSQDSGTPTGNIAAGESGVTIAKFDVYAAGEPVKIKFLDFQIAFTGVSSTSLDTLSNQIKNVSLIDDAGGQVGTTINTPPSSNSSCSQVGTAAYPTPSSTVSTYSDCFGTASSPINYIVPANTTRVLSLKVDVQSTATFSTILGKLVAETNTANLQGLTSSKTANSSGASGSSLSLQSTLLSASANSAYGNQTVTPNSTGVHIGSYALTASSASGVQLNTLSLQAYPNGTSGRTADIQNLRVMVNGAQFGNEYGVVSDQGTYSFSGSPFTVPAGGTTYVDVYADILSSALTTTDATALTGCSGTGVTSYNAVSCTGTTYGQNLTVAAQGSTDMTVGLDSSAPGATQLVMGSTGNTLAAYRFAETSNVEPLKITDLTVTQNTAATSSAFQNVTLYNGSNAIGISGSAATSTAGFTFAFHFSTPVSVPQAGATTLTLKGDVASYTNIGTSGIDNTTSTFSVASSSITALGASSNYAPTITGNATGSVMTVLRTTLTPSATVLGATSNRAKSSVDNLATVTFTANSAGSAMLKSLTLNFSGNGIATSTGSVATGTITITNNPTSFGYCTIQINGFNVSIAVATSSGNNTVALVASAFTSAINASSSLLGVTAASSSNAVALTATTAGTSGNITLSGTSPQNGVSFTFATTNGNNVAYNTGGYGLMSNITLRDVNNNDVVGSDSATPAMNCATQSTCLITWTFPTSTFVISGGTSYSFTLQANTNAGAGTLVNTGTGTQSLGVSIQSTTSTQYLDAGDTSGVTVSLPTTQVPMNVASVSFTSGS